MNRPDDFIPVTDIKDLPTWAQWQGDGPAPPHWYAVNPETGEHEKVYRTYENYCDD